MNDNETLAEMLKSSKEDFEYYKRNNKEIRERDVAILFISKLNIVYEDSEFVSLVQNNKADVCFKGAMFQIKELPDPVCRRNKFYKDRYNSIAKAERLDQVSLVGEVQDVPMPEKMYDLVFERARQLSCSDKYVNEKSGLDLLIYVTRTRASIIQAKEINSDEFLKLGWRSISCVNSKQVVVLSSTEFAPSFILDKLGVVINIDS